MNNKIDELLEEYKTAKINNDIKNIEKIENIFRQIGIEPFGLEIIAFA